MRARRRDSFRGKMVNYSHMLVAALSVTAVVLLVKYRSLTTLMAEEEKEYMENQKLLLDDLGKETERTKMLNEELNQRMEDIKKVEGRLKGTQDELSNSVNALQASNDQIEAMKLEKESLLDDLNNAKEDNSALQIQLGSVQDELQKTKALVDDNTMTIKDSQNKQERLLSENSDLSQKLTNLQGLQAENENLRAQVANAIKSAQVSDARVKELETQLQDKREPIEKPKDEPKDKPKEEPKETEHEPKLAIPEVKNQLPILDLPKEPKEVKEEVKNLKEEPKIETLAEEPKGKNPDYKVDEKEVEKDIEVYDMLNDEEKTKLKRELTNNELEVAGGGEVVDNPEVPDDENAYGIVLADGEGRELDNVAAGNDAAEENEEGDLDQENDDENADENNNEVDDKPGVEPDGNVLPEPKAFEEMKESGGSFGSQGQRALLSWQDESSKQ